ncbi:thioredoxin [Nocardia otitidiscaviarum]|uniref:thioredoxin n=1 Tax=Nocardia otitidiscaviarum TaxID=1823 RepID=UPI0031452F1D
MKQLAADLVKREIDVRFDGFVDAGTSITQFMEASVRDSDFVVLVCTPSFAKKADARTGGTGYEAQIVSTEIFYGCDQRKFIPILRSGSSHDAMPTYLRGKLSIDFRTVESYNAGIESLVSHIQGELRRASPGEVRPRPHGVTPAPRPKSGGTVIDVDDSSFRRTISSLEGNRVKLVNFRADWCGPCKMVAPVLENIASEYGESVDVIQIDVDNSPAIAGEYNIRAIPTMIAFRNGQARNKLVGAKGKAALLRELQPLISEVDEVRAVEQDSIALTFHRGKIRVVKIRPDGTYSYIDETDQRLGLVYVNTVAAEHERKVTAQFEELLNDAYLSRKELVRFLEANPQLILERGYSAAHSQILLRHETGNLAPNFLLQPIAGELCDLLEVEPPQHEIATIVNGVTMLSEVVIEAVARIRAYRDYFEEERNRLRIQDDHGLTVFRPKMFVIIGRSRLLDPLARRRLESTLGDISLRTWDEVLAITRRRLAP